MFNLQKKQLQKYLQVGIPIFVILGITWKLIDEYSLGRFEDLRVLWKGLVLNYPILFLIVVCSFLNWSLEAFKWKELVAPVEKINFRKALKSVLVGLSLGFFTPRSIGDYFGRTVLLNSVNKLQILGGLLVSRLSQMLATVCLGVLGLVYLKAHFFNGKEYFYVLLSAIVVFVLIFVLFFLRKTIIQRLTNFSKLRKIVSFFFIIKDYKNRLYWKVLVLSFLRYASFLLQFILVAFLFNVSIEVLPFLAVVSVVLLLKSLVPSFNFFSDLGVREFGALMLFPFIGIGSVTGISIGLVVWGANVLLPSLLGVLLIWRVKWEW